MKRKTIALSTLLGALSLPAGLALAADTMMPAQDETQAQERVYGSQLMTRQERAEYRARMQAAKTAEEREQIRNEHHERMKERARERGVTLPDEPPARGGRMMMEPGSGMGQGGGSMGPGGGGMGSGGGRNR